MKQIKLKELKELTQTVDKPLFVIFSTKWCGICKMNLPVIQPLIDKYADRVEFFMVDVDEESAWEEDGNKEYAIHIVPTYHLYASQQLKFKHSNFLTPAVFEKELNKVIKNK